MIYRFSADYKTQKVTSALMASCIIGLLVNLLQTFGIISLFDLVALLA